MAVRFCKQCHKKTFHEPSGKCRSCRFREYGQKNKGKIKVRNAEYKRTHKQEISNSGKLYYQKNKKRIKENVKQYSLKNKQVIQLKKHAYYEKHKEAWKQQAHERYMNNHEAMLLWYRKRYYRNRKKRIQANMRYYNQPLPRLIKNVRGRIMAALKYNHFTKNKHILEILGCTKEEFFNHLVKTAYNRKDGTPMFLGCRDVQVDHIIPLSYAKTEEQIYRLCHYTNTQWLWKEDNNSKHANINWKHPVYGQQVTMQDVNRVLFGNNNKQVDAC